jgi:hypothetical protein
MISAHSWFQTYIWTSIFWTETEDLLHTWKHMASNCSMDPIHWTLDMLLGCRTVFGCWFLGNLCPDSSWCVYDVHYHK